MMFEHQGAHSLLHLSHEGLTSIHAPAATHSYHELVLLLLRCAGLKHLSALQRLEALDVRCDKPHAVARLASQLPRLHTLSLQCCSAAGVTAKPYSVLALDAVTALTQLRLQVSADDADIVQRSRWPPDLQVWPQCCLLLCAVHTISVMPLCVRCAAQWVRRSVRATEHIFRFAGPRPGHSADR